MKRIVFILTLVLLLSSCDDDKKEFSLVVAVQSSFDQDQVQVFIDGEEIVNRKLQTNYSVGVCFLDGEAGLNMGIAEGNHLIKVSINNTVTETAEFNVNNDLYIGINYDQQTSRISFIYANEPFAYD